MKTGFKPRPSPWQGGVLNPPRFGISPEVRVRAARFQPAHASLVGVARSTIEVAAVVTHARELSMPFPEVRRPHAQRHT
jgi:hypothetical protein